jgi:hypothetical protein
VQRALIDKLPSAELASLLQSPQGEKLMQAVVSGAAPGRSIVASIERGIVVLLTGVGLLAAAVFTQAPGVIVLAAVVLISTGIGLLVAAFVSYRLSKRWNLLGRNDGTLW